MLTRFPDNIALLKYPTRYVWTLSDYIKSEKYRYISYDYIRNIGKKVVTSLDKRANMLPIKTSYHGY